MLSGGFDAWEFLTIILLLFGLFLFLAGVFTAYFGSGKSRTIGVGLLVAGLVIGIVGVLLYKVEAHVSLSSFFSGFLVDLILVLLASVLGALAAVAVFLLAIMKS